MKSLSNRKSLLLAGVSLPLVMLAVGWPMIVSTGWHILADNPVRFESITIRVPRGWIAIQRDQQLVVYQPTSSLLAIWRGEEASVSFLSGLPRGFPTGAEEAWIAAERKSFAREGFLVSRIRKRDAFGISGTIHCIEAREKSPGRIYKNSCFVGNGMYYVFFVGPETAIPDFEEMLTTTSNFRP
jgi:hypothetical protein